MDLLKAQLARIQQQLGGLTASQKMLAGTLVAVMVFTLMWWAKYAGEPDMEPVLNQSLAQQDIAQITSRLDSKGIHYQVSGDKIMVPADRKIEVLADLTYAHALPRDIKSGFDEMVKQMNPFDSESRDEAMYNEAKARTLVEIIRMLPGVSDAMVMIDPTTERRFNGDSIQPTASVAITTRGDGQANPKLLAEDSAALVGGAQSGLARSRINIVIDGVPRPVRDPGEDDMVGGDSLLDTTRQWDEYYRGKIAEQLRFIKGAFISVNMAVDNTTSHVQQHTIDEKKSMKAETDIETRSTETTGGPGGADAGVAPNTQLSIPSGGGGGGGGGSTTEDDKTKIAILPSYSDNDTRKPAGTATVTSAAVRVPHSYFVGIFKNLNGGKDPDEAALKQMETTEFENIRREVKACTHVDSDDAVVVAEYNDPYVPPVVTQQAASPVPALVGTHAKEIAVGALAFLSLFMVSMMVRKGSPAPIPAVAAAPPEPTIHPVPSDLAGEVGEGDPLLDAMELDEEAVKTQQMLDQVQKMVTENPDSAATLVKRWLNRS